MPSNLRFIVPKLHIAGQQDLVIAKIAELVEHLFPGSHCNAINIYRTLIDELHKNGTVTYDYTKWDELIENKALTSEKIKKTIGVHTSTQELEKIKNELNLILVEMNEKYLFNKNIRDKIENIYFQRLAFPSSFSLSIKSEIKDAIKKASKVEDKDIINLINNTVEILSFNTKEKLGSQQDVLAEIIFEIITGTK